MHCQTFEMYHKSQRIKKHREYNLLVIWKLPYVSKLMYYTIDTSVRDLTSEREKKTFGCATLNSLIKISCSGTLPFREWQCVRTSCTITQRDIEEGTRK